MKSSLDSEYQSQIIMFSSSRAEQKVASLMKKRKDVVDYLSSSININFNSESKQVSF